MFAMFLFSFQQQLVFQYVTQEIMNIVIMGVFLYKYKTFMHNFTSVLQAVDLKLWNDLLLRMQAPFLAHTFYKDHEINS